MAYQCSKVGNNFNVYLNIDDYDDFQFPLDQNEQHLDYPKFPHRDIPSYYIYDTSDLSESESAFIKQLSVTFDEAATIESTRSQSNCALLFNQRKGRVTASRIYDVNNWKRGLAKHAEKFVSLFSESTATVSNPVLLKKLEHGKIY